jgi:hypothetical protein
VCLLTIRIYSRINNLTIQTRTTILQNKYSYLNAVKKKHQYFLYSVNNLNQRNLPSATLVSKEIETDFNSLIVVRFFFQRSRKVPEVADLSISCGWGVVGSGSLLTS